MEQKILDEILRMLRQMESGEIITVSELVKNTGLAKGEVFEDSAVMLYLCDEILRAAKREGIVLESVYGEDAEIGMPYNISYGIKRKYGKGYLTKENCTSVKYKAGGYMCCRPSLYAEADRGNLSEENWTALMSILFDHCKIQNWFDLYENYGVLDGYYWELELTLNDGRTAIFNGSNKEPRGLRMLEKALGPWAKDYLGSIDYDSKEEKQ